MFAKVKVPLGALTTYVTSVLQSTKTRAVTAVAWLVVLFMGAQPAQAATIQPSAVGAATPPNILCYIGAPSLAIFDPAKESTKLITGIILGLAIAAAAFCTIWGGIRVLTAGKRTDKAADGIRQVSHVGLGLLVIFGGLVIIGILVTLLVGLVNFQSC